MRYNFKLCNTLRFSSILALKTSADEENDMTDFAAALTELRRPKILIRAARAGLAEYRPERDLKRLVRGERDPLQPLLVEESRLEATRAAGAGAYNIHRHVAVLTALLAEARRLADLQPAAADPAFA